MRGSIMIQAVTALAVTSLVQAQSKGGVPMKPEDIPKGCTFNQSSSLQCALLDGAVLSKLLQASYNGNGCC
jgi:hypothetical protein